MGVVIRGRSVTVLVAVVVGLLGCTSSPSAPGTPPTTGPTATPEGPDDPTGGTLRIGLASDPRTLDPRFTADEEGALVAGAVFEPLVRLGPTGRPLPGAATSWDVSEDGTVFTFELLEARFHDGTEVTADDVVRTFRRIADGTAQPRSFLAPLLEPVVGAEEAARDGVPLRGVEAVDDRTVRIELSAPQPRYLLTLADPSLVPTPPLADEDPEAFAARPIGNGPFALAAVPEPGEFIRLLRVDDHHRRAQLDEVVLQVYPDDPARDRQWQDLRNGLLQVADIGPSHRTEAATRYGLADDEVTGPGVLQGLTTSVAMLGFSVDVPPFDDPVVRRAISQSIDRQAIGRDVLGGLRRPADAIVPPSVPGSQLAPCDHCRADPEGAAALLAEAGVELPDAVTFHHPRGLTQSAVARAIAADVEAALGVEVRLVAADLDEFVPAVVNGEAPWFRLGWEVTAPDPGAYLVPLFRSDSPDNLTGYADDETDALLDEAVAAADDESAHAAFAAAEQRVLDAVAVAPLVVSERARVVAPSVSGLRWDPTGRVDLTRVQIVEN